MRKDNSSIPSMAEQLEIKENLESLISMLRRKRKVRGSRRRRNVSKKKARKEQPC